MKESVAIAKEANRKKESSPTRSDNSIQRLRNEPERQLGSLRDVIGNIRRNGGTPSVESIATELSVMPYSNRASALLALQQTHGNHYVQRVVTGIQAKLKVGQLDDKYEQEADRVAEQVMNMPEPQVQRQIEPEDEETLWTKGVPSQIPGVTPNLESRIQSLKGSGQPLPEADRGFMERRFGVDFSGVRMHADSNAIQMNRELNAEAFAYGKDIYFGAGRYNPSTSSGKRLLAHELTHVIQQGKALGGIQRLTLRDRTSEKGPERKTETQAAGPVQVQGRLGVARLQRQADITQAPPGLPCALVTGAGHLPGSHLLFPISRANFNPNHVAQITAFVNRWTADGARDDIQVDGYASVDGPQRYNWRLSCDRAEAVKSEVIAQGVPASKVTTVAHGETNEFSATDFVRNRRAIISRHPSTTPTTTPSVPQLSANVVTGPDPGNCGTVNFVINWSLSRNSSPNGGFVIQDVTFTWNERDCANAPVPDPGGRTSPLRYFEAWRVGPNSTNFTVDGNSDTFSWVNGITTGPNAGCTRDNVRIIATARYHDTVATLPSHMTANNPRTFAGTLRSSLTDPATGGNISTPVEHRLMFRWNCCPCRTTRRTIVDAHTP